MQEQLREALRRDLARLADGDRSAFEPVFAAALPLVRDLTRRMLGEADAEDAAQEALIKVFARAGEYDPERDALAWILAIAGYECRTVRKRRLRRREVAIDAATDGSDATPEDRLLEREIGDALGETLGALSSADAATIALAIERERGGAVGVAAATFRKRLQRALARLRAAWHERYGHE